MGFDRAILPIPLRSPINGEETGSAAGAKTVIALTHLGFSKDQELVSKTTDLDLVVGGHSHTLIDRLILFAIKMVDRLPSFKAGEHAKYLGKLLVDIAEDGSVRF